MKTDRPRAGLSAGWHIPLIFMVAVSVLPILFALLTSFKGMQDIFGGRFFSSAFTLENYRSIQNQLPVARIALNSLLVASVVTFFKLTTSTLAAYAFAYYDFRGKSLLYYVLISTIFIPFTVTMIPNYLIISKLRLFDTIWGVVLPELADASGIFLLRQSMRSIPKALTEIADLDGVGRMRTLRDIVLPVCRPSLTATGIIFFINNWNEYVWPTLILRTKERYTLPLAMQLFSSAEAGSEFTMIMAMAVLTMLAPVVLYLIFQRYIMSTFASSGIKG